MNKPNTYLITAMARVTIEVVATDDESALAQFDDAELSDFKLLDIDVIEFENEGEHYAD